MEAEILAIPTDITNATNAGRGFNMAFTDTLGFDPATMLENDFCPLTSPLPENWYVPVTIFYDGCFNMPIQEELILQVGRQ